MKSGIRQNDGVYKLTDEMIEDLERMGFQWIVTATFTFEECLGDLQRFKNKYGHSNVPRKYKENPSLGHWCHTIRVMKSGIRQNDGVYKLTDEMIEDLERMGFQWIVTATFTFEECLGDLQQFKNKYGHCNVPSKYKENPSLGNWCITTRRMKSGCKPNVGVYKLTDDSARITKLEEMGFWFH